MVIDREHLGNPSIGQLADYIGMVGFAPIREHPRFATVPTILSLFDDTEATKPQGLTKWDEAFLSAVNRAKPGDVMQTSKIKLRMSLDLIR